MSRSLGDSIAHTVGIISDPEVVAWELGGLDRAVVLGSDGLWEFVNSQEVAEIVGAHWAESDLEGTCDQLVRLAVTRWRREDVVDDITVLVVYLHA
jgi:serine/threonine protein phosphatase PrpC